MLAEFDDLICTDAVSCNIVNKIAGALAVSGAVVWAVVKLTWAKVLKFNNFLRSRQRALSAVARAVTLDGPKEGAGIWALQPITQPENYKNDLQGARILAVANLKGGVGKTTIAANIAAHLANDRAWQKRVLLVDLDYQGSLSSMSFPDDSSWLPPAQTDSVATRSLSGDLEPNLFLAAATAVNQQPRLKVITAHYDLAQADNRLLIEWLLNVAKTEKRDWKRWLADFFIGKLYQPHEMRYNLAKLLHSQAVREAFDLVIIDCPPRLTAGTIQAFCGSSHVLIPTILDKPSGESIVSFCEQVEALKSAGLCPHIRYLGIVATRYNPRVNSGPATVQFVNDQLTARKFKCGFLPQSTFIPQTEALVREASQGIAYFTLHGNSQAAKAKNAIASLAQHVALQIGVPPVQSFDLTDQQQLSLPVAAE